MAVSPRQLSSLTQSLQPTSPTLSLKSKHKPMPLALSTICILNGSYVWISAHLWLHPCTCFTICRGLHTCYLTRKTSSHQYVLNPLNVIRLLHCYNSCTVDTLDNFDVSFKKCGSKHLLGTAIHQKHPVTPSILLEIWHHLNTNLPLHSTICALFCTAFFSFLHKLNLTVASATSSATSFDPRCHRQDVTQSTSLHTLDENSPPQGRPPYHSASQHSRLYSLPCVCPSTILYARPHFLISTVVLSSHYFWPSSCYLYYL